MKNYKLLILFFLFIAASYTVKAQIKFGYDAPEIALPTTAGDTLRLSSLKGKVVLLDFWASWCRPCRETNKGLARLYKKYKANGFEIYGVSLDAKKNDWMKAIKQDKITWLQVNDNGGWDARTVNDWHINAIPNSYLIDKEGKLFAVDLEGKDLEKALKDMLGN